MSPIDVVFFRLNLTPLLMVFIWIGGSLFIAYTILFFPLGSFADKIFNLIGFLVAFRMICEAANILFKIHSELVAMNSRNR
jgi:predicted ferric reductase